MEKLVILIPCFNEEENIAETILSLPKQVDGFSKTEILLVDDGSTDKTVELAKSLGVENIISHPKNLGLGRAFTTGIESALKMDADVILNFDADGQYCEKSIPKLLEPIIKGNAQVTIGIRPIMRMAQFSFVKKLLQKLGSFVVSVVAGVWIQDVTSGFRAIHKSAARDLRIDSSYSYTVEMIIRLARHKFRIVTVPVDVSGRKVRPSRLVNNNFDYIIKTIKIIFRTIIAR